MHFLQRSHAKTIKGNSMTILTVGPTSTFPTIAAAMAAASTGDIVALETGYGNENATVTVDGLSFDGGPSSTDVDLQLASGIGVITLLGTAPINVLDGSDANTIVGNDGDNIISVSSGVDVVAGGNGSDRLIIDYSAATAAITGTMVGVTDGGTHAVTFSAVENLTISTGSGNDTITVGDGSNVLATGAGDDTITAGNGPNVIDGGGNNDTITAGSGANTILGRSGNDTIVAGDGGNTIDGGDGNDGITTGAGNDIVNAGLGNDTIITGGGADVITVNGGVDTVDSGSENDRLIVDYSSSTTAVTGGVTGGTLIGGYDGAFADGAATSSVVFQGTESFTVTAGSGNDIIATGDGNDVLDGGAGSDQLNSGGGTDTLLIGLGNDALDGGAGTDTVIFSGARANYQVTDLGGGVFQSTDLRAGSPDGTDTLVNIEGFVFTDGTFDMVTVLIVAPTTTVATLAFSADTGISNSDFITSTAAQNISGTLSANLANGESVEVSLDNGTTWTTATAAVGTDTFSLAGQTLTASNVLEARVTNSTASGIATTQAYVLDTIAPNEPSTPVLTSASDSGAQGDGITNVTMLTVTGTAEAGSTVKLYDTDGTTVLGTSVTAGDGTYSITSSTLSGGNHTLSVSATDTAGSVSPISSGTTVTIDTTAPAAPTLTLAHDTGLSATDGITSDPTIGVTAEAGATLLYKLDAAAGFSATAPVFATDGSNDGLHTVLVEQQDAAGNISASSLSFMLDTTAPAAPTLTLAHDSGLSAADGITSDPTIGVTAEAGATLLYKVDAAAGFSATAPVFATDGSNDGLHTVLVEQQDAAGNIGSASSLSFILDTTAPAAPTLTLAHDSGLSATDGITSDPSIVYSSAESGGFFLYAADGAANFSFAVPSFVTDSSADGSHTVLVMQEDAAGNTGAASSLSFTLDTIAPNVTGLSALLASSSGGTTINFNLAFDEAVKVAGGTPALVLNNGSVAAYDAAATVTLGDSSKLVFDHLITSPVSFVEVTAFAPHGSVVADLAGNVADVSHVAASFSNLADNSFAPPHMPFAFDL
jgi:Ca2+-binding RTX toxin-like protein